MNKTKDRDCHARIVQELVNDVRLIRTEKISSLNSMKKYGDADKGCGGK